MNILYLVLLYLVLQQVWVLWMLVNLPASRLLASDQNKLRDTGVILSETTDKGEYSITHSIEDGIERIVYVPKNRGHETPILMAHGMWHGAWCWQAWQTYLAERGWQSIAYSLPGHGKSPVQKRIAFCTLSYYLAFLRDEVNRLSRKPVLIGHSMGGALSQWYLRHVNDDLPAIVLVAPWTSHTAVNDSMPMFLKLDPLGMFLVFLTWNARPYVRNPQVAARALITDGAILSPEELFARLNNESLLVTLQHNPPFWYPAENVKTPILLLAGEKDAVVGIEPLRKSAAHYNAEYVIIPKAGHNLMMEKSYLETARSIDNWLIKKQVP